MSAGNHTMKLAMTPSKNQARKREPRPASSCSSGSRSRPASRRGAYGLLVLTSATLKPRERRDSDVKRVRLSPAGLPIADHAAGHDGTEPARERGRAHDPQRQTLAGFVGLDGAGSP